MLKRMFAISRPIRDIISVILYLIFFVYMIKLIVDTPELSGKLAYLLMLVGIGGVAAWFESMKWVLQSAIKQTIMLCDEQKAEKRLDFLDKYTKFHPYAGSVCILRLMLMLDHCRYEEAAAFAERNARTVMAQNAEFKLVARHSRFIAYGELGNAEKCAEFYRSACELKVIRVNNKAKAMAPYYSWDEIDAGYYYYTGKPKEGLRAVQKVSDHSMNPREKMNYHYLFARLLHENGYVKRALEELEAAIANTMGNAFMENRLQELCADWKAAK